MKKLFIASIFGVAAGGLFLMAFGPTATEENPVRRIAPVSTEDFLPVQYVEFEPMEIVGKKNQNIHFQNNAE